MNIIELHSETWEQLALRREALPHALLFSGQRGIGAFELARAFSESLLCEQPRSRHEACGVCPACGWLKNGNHPDFRLIQPEAWAAEDSAPAEAGKKTRKPSQQITIDQVRALEDFLHVGTHRQGARIVLIHPAEAMNRSTANSLLKSLEEPIPSTLFILVSSESERLLPTIRSRCQAMPVPLPAQEKSEAWLQHAGIAESKRWLALAGASPLLAVDLAESGERRLVDAVVAELGQGGSLDAVAAAGRLDLLVKAETRPAPLKRLVEWSQKWLFDLLLCRAALPVRYYLEQAQTLARLGLAADGERLLALTRKTLQYRQECQQPLNNRLFLEEFFMGYVALFTPQRGKNG